MEPELRTTPTGRYVASTTTGERVRAFVPHPLPPDLNLSIDTLDVLGRANRELGRLDILYSLNLVPEAFVELLTYSFVRKEALLSSQIEGTQSSYADLLMHEDAAAPGVPNGEDVREVSQYVAALQHGMDRIGEGFPLVLRLIREMHQILLDQHRGQHASPGQFRRSQVWIGGSRPGNATFVPPPPSELATCLDDLERFIHDPDYPVVLKAALAHLQFETIHPFLDGNGRIGRLLITLLFSESRVLEAPVLYLSLYFKANREEYYNRLQRVRTHGEWEEWLQFFLFAVGETASQTLDATVESIDLFERDQDVIDGLGRQAESVSKVYETLLRYPVTTVPQATSRLDLTYPTVQSALRRLEKEGIVEETTGSARGKVYRYSAYMDILERGTEPL